jgi:hypothetical protein
MSGWQIIEYIVWHLTVDSYFCKVTYAFEYDFEMLLWELLI